MIIKQRTADVGVNGFISGHSLRVGSAVSLAKAGVLVVDLQMAGRWKTHKCQHTMPGQSVGLLRDIRKINYKTLL